MRQTTTAWIAAAVVAVAGALVACAGDDPAASSTTTSTTGPPRLVGPAAFTVWRVPDRSTEIDRDVVPYLLPDDHVPGATVRYEGHPGEARNTYEQTWLWMTTDQPFPAIVGLRTELTGAQPPDPAGTWTIREHGLGSLTLEASGGEVSVSSRFIEPAALRQLAEQLVLDGDGVGWSLPSSSSGEQWFPLVEGWSGPRVGRSTRSTTQLLEIAVERNAPNVLGNLAMHTTGTLRVTEIGGSPALVIGRQGFEIVGWQRDDGVVIIVAGQDAVDVAAALNEVDRATWLAAAEPGPEQNLSTGCGTIIYDC